MIHKEKDCIAVVGGVEVEVGKKMNLILRDLLLILLEVWLEKIDCSHCSSYHKSFHEVQREVVLNY